MSNWKLTECLFIQNPANFDVKGAIMVNEMLRKEIKLYKHNNSLAFQVKSCQPYHEAALAAAASIKLDDFITKIKDTEKVDDTSEFNMWTGLSSVLGEHQIQKITFKNFFEIREQDNTFDLYLFSPTKKLMYYKFEKEKASAASPFRPRKSVKRRRKLGSKSKSRKYLKRSSKSTTKRSRFRSLKLRRR